MRLSGGALIKRSFYGNYSLGVKHMALSKLIISCYNREIINTINIWQKDVLELENTEKHVQGKLKNALQQNMPCWRQGKSDKNSVKNQKHPFGVYRALAGKTLCRVFLVNLFKNRLGEMLGNELGHFKHVDYSFASEDFLQSLVSVDVSLVCRVLKVV